MRITITNTHALDASGYVGLAAWWAERELGVTEPLLAAPEGEPADLTVTFGANDLWALALGTGIAAQLAPGARLGAGTYYAGLFLPTVISRGDAAPQEAPAPAIALPAPEPLAEPAPVDAAPVEGEPVEGEPHAAV